MLTTPITSAGGYFVDDELERLENQVSVYRAWNYTENYHLYETNYNDFINSANNYHYDLTAHSHDNWVIEGVVFTADKFSKSNNTPVYEFRNRFNNSTFFTSSDLEKSKVETTFSNTWEYVGVPFYSYLSEDSSQGIKKIYRFWNSNLGIHFYTTSEKEKNDILLNFKDWSFEESLFYVKDVNESNYINYLNQMESIADEAVYNFNVLITEKLNKELSFSIITSQDIDIIIDGSVDILENAKINVEKIENNYYRVNNHKAIVIKHLNNLIEKIDREIKPLAKKALLNSSSFSLSELLVYRSELQTTVTEINIEFRNLVQYSLFLTNTSAGEYPFELLDVFNSRTKSMLRLFRQTQNTIFYEADRLFSNYFPYYIF